VGANFLGFNGVVLSVIDDVPVDNEVPVLTSSISKIVGLVFEDAHRVGLYLGLGCTFIGVSVRVLDRVYVCF
jgi:hypothetical protein